MHSSRFNVLVRYAPVWTYLFVYVFTCLIAAALFFFEDRKFVALVEYFSGAIAPKSYSPEQAEVLWYLLLGAPTLLSFGFVAAQRLCISAGLPFLRKLFGSNDESYPSYMPMLLFTAAVSIASYDLQHAGAFAKLCSWVNYGNWVQERYQLFSKLGYFSFVNLYLILPVSAAWLVLRVSGSRWTILVKRLIPLTVVVFLSLFLFQKKPLIVSLIFIFGTVVLQKVLHVGWSRRLTWLFIAAISALLVAWAILVVLPIYSEASKTIEEVMAQNSSAQKPSVSDKRLRLAGEIRGYIGSKRSSSIITYSLLAPLTRTSLPAMYYPVVYPAAHPYYGFDFGQDVLGFGGMPDDNTVIWNYMYPAEIKGSTGAPFQFSLYSQVGVMWALSLCIAVGVALGVIWKIVLADGINVSWRCLTGSVLIMFSIYIAMDSVRGSLLSSYGLVWAWLFVNLSFFICRLVNHRQLSAYPDQVN